MKFLPGLALTFFVVSCMTDQNQDYQVTLYNSDYLHRSVKKLTDIMVYDIFSPPVAARVYAYPAIAAYEILAQIHPEYRSLAGQLSELDPIPPIDSIRSIDPYLSAIEAYTLLGQNLIFSEEKMSAFRDSLHHEWKQMGIPSEVLKDSRSYADEVVNHFSMWMKRDQYNETRTMPKFSMKSDPGRWEPTPPDYMGGIEPHWDKIRLMVIDSADQFIPAAPPSFDTVPGSTFYEAAMEVYDAVNLKEDRYIEIASFWDCNPFVSHHQGHVMFGTKKISPGGHWMGITGIASKKSKFDPMETINAYAMVSLGLYDAFIICWDEKYRSNLIRPETYINRYIDPMWRPLLQTPPFPEHTSGHSVVSRVSAVILTGLFGDDFAFDDTVEMEYGLPMRSFPSFHAASKEAAISRLYGGIHYMPAIQEGMWQGEQVGDFILKNVQTKVGTIVVHH